MWVSRSFCKEPSKARVPGRIAKATPRCRPRHRAYKYVIRTRMHGVFPRNRIPSCFHLSAPVAISRHERPVGSSRRRAAPRGKRAGKTQEKPSFFWGFSAFKFKVLSRHVYRRISSRCRAFRSGRRHWRSYFSENGVKRYAPVSVMFRYTEIVANFFKQTTAKTTRDKNPVEPTGRLNVFKLNWSQSAPKRVSNLNTRNVKPSSIFFSLKAVSSYFTNVFMTIQLIFCDSK